MSASELDYKLVMCDWLEEEKIRQAKLLWVLDNKIDWKAVMVGPRNKIPLLVPEEHEKLKELCVGRNCGMYYGADPKELEVCLKYLAENVVARESMGKNGLKAFYAGNRST